jgi:hypothetical protein
MAEIITTQSFSDGDVVTATKLNNIQANASIQPEAITNKSAETVVDSSNDFLLMYDASAVALKKVIPSNIVKAGTTSNFSVGGSATVGGTLGVTGLITATGGVAGAIAGNVTGNVIGNVTGNVTGNVSGSSGSCTGNAGTATALQTGRSIGITGDVSITSGTFNGTADLIATSTLAASGVTAGTYGGASSIPQITVDAKGRITSATTNSAVPSDGSVTSAKMADLSPSPAGSVGSASLIPILTINAKGQVTSYTTASAAAGATGGGTDKIFWENDQTMTTNYTLTASKNALSAGPITVGTGVTVTIPTGGVWTVV